MNNTSCECTPEPNPESCQNDIGLAAGIGVLVAGLLILVTWLIFYYCHRKSFPCVDKLGGTKKRQATTSSHKYFAGNYFVDANDSYLLESGKPPVDFNYFHEGNESKYNAVPLEASQAVTPDGTAHRQLAPQPSQTSAALLQDIGTSSNFSPDLGDRANFPIIGTSENPLAMVDSNMSLGSTSTAGLDLSFWPSLPGESNVDLRPPVLTARVGNQGGEFVSESMHIILAVPSGTYKQAVTMTIGTSSRPEDQPELDQASSLVSAVYTSSPSIGNNGKCRLRVPLSCHVMDVDDSDESGYDTLPEVSNLTVMVNKSVSDSLAAEWVDAGPILEFIETPEETRAAGGDCPAGYVEFEVQGAAMYTVRCDSGIWVKSMCLSHFAAALDEDQTWTLRVFLHRDRTVDYEIICQYAKEFNMMPVGMPQPFHLPQHSYVHVVISSITEGCALEGSSHGVLHGEGCWPNLDQPPFVEFRLRQVHGCLPLPLIRVRMDVVVADDFDNITFELLSQWSTMAQMKMDKRMPDALASRGKLAGAWPWTLVSPWQQLTGAQVKQMATILDRPLMGDQDYSTLAALLGYTEEQVKFFSLQRPSPTEALLKDLHTRLPVTRVADRLVVALGRMGAVWLSDFLRQACRVDRVQYFEDAESNVGDTLPRRAASGIYSSIRRTLNGTLKLTDEEKHDSLGHYQRRVQRMSGRRLVTNRKTSQAGSASVAIYANTTLPRQNPASAPPTAAGNNASRYSWNRQASGDYSENFTDGDGDDTSPDTVGPLVSSTRSDVELTPGGSGHKQKNRGQSTHSIYGSTKVVMEKHGRLAQVMGDSGPTSKVYTVHHDPSAPHRAILQPAPYINHRLHTSFHESIDQGLTSSMKTDNESSFVHRVAKKLTRTSSMPSTQRNTKRKAKDRQSANDVVEDTSPVHREDPVTSSQVCLAGAADPSPRRKRAPYEEHIVPFPRKESLHPRHASGDIRK